MTPFRLVLALCLSLAAFPASAAEKKLVIHEWGTFTALQDDNGEALAGVNTDDEPVPAFVHSAGQYVTTASELTPAFEARTRTTKGSVPRLHAGATMRLETPVVYFYLPKGEKNRKLDVNVVFNGGWLSQYYPDAVTNLGSDNLAVRPLTAETKGSLSWKELEIGAAGEGPATEDKVWTAPRAVKAATVRAKNGETEKFLFYRGLGHVPSPLTAKRDDKNLSVAGDEAITEIWRVDVLADGKVAFRKDDGKHSFGHFAGGDYSAANAGALRKELQKALVKAGLYEDEAAAMLKTWEYSYFKAAGERVFYIVPPSWTDTVLPIKFSASADVTRVMIGRIELLGPQQRDALSRMKQASADGINAFIEKSTKDVKDWNLYMEVNRGRKPVSALGAEVPAIYKEYLQLGRFRDAILLNENKQRPSPSLAQFIEQNQIGLHQAQ